MNNESECFTGISKHEKTMSVFNFTLLRSTVVAFTEIFVSSAKMLGTDSSRQFGRSLI
jgi:hypothetical protein